MCSLALQSESDATVVPAGAFILAVCVIRLQKTGLFCCVLCGLFLVAYLGTFARYPAFFTKQAISENNKGTSGRKGKENKGRRAPIVSGVFFLCGIERASVGWCSTEW
ncbi:hypothetical protein CDAR_404971 [Caerostris darwini]|uniref:Uncharacterized protein n=1 Tax=Caerostris darwini TaxID=1538125 RepID=A0AAV4U6P9_9ARAC|nr:hypothetical protein CDAR_404971 [Caerostris darwini]